LKKFIFHIFLFTSFLFLPSCIQKKDVKSENKIPKQELQILLTDPVQTLDPLKILYSSDWKVASNIFEALVTLNNKNEIIPELAESYSINENKLLYTFKLKKNVYFHDSPCFKNGQGRKLNAEDIKYTFERLAKKNNAFPNWQNISGKIVGIEKFHQGNSETISGISVIDSFTVSFLLTKPFSPFLKILTTPNFYIVPKEAVEYFGNDFGFNPIGTGPFRISEFRKYKKIQLVKNENYYLKDSNNVKLPYINSICYQTINKSENKLNAFVTNKTDIVEINNVDYNKIKSSKSFIKNYNVIRLNISNHIRFWGFNFGKENNLNKKIRTAIVKSFDRKKIIDNVKQNKPAETLVPKHFLRKPNESKSYKTENFLTDVKFSNRIKNDTVIVLSNFISKDLIEIEKAINKIGMYCKRIIKPDGYYKNIKKIKPDLFRVSMIPSYPDAIEYYSLFYSKSSGEINFGRFFNKEYDKIYEKILFENKPELLNKYYLQLEKILKEEAATIYLTYQGPTFLLYPKNLKGIKINYILIDFRKAYFN